MKNLRYLLVAILLSAVAFVGIVWLVGRLVGAVVAEFRS
jgi:hypothetical protein